MALTTAQATALAADIRANVDATVVAALAIRNDDAIRDWYNTASTTDAWESAVTRQKLYEAMNISQFDGLTGGKRDAWRLFLEQAGLVSHDFGRQQNRNAVTDIWSAGQADSILAACVRKATRAELVFGGQVEQTGGVSATDLQVEVVLSSIDVSLALNNNP